VKARPTALTSF